MAYRMEVMSINHHYPDHHPIHPAYPHDSTWKLPTSSGRLQALWWGPTTSDFSTLHNPPTIACCRAPPSCLQTALALPRNLAASRTLQKAMSHLSTLRYKRLTLSHTIMSFIVPPCNTRHDFLPPTHHPRGGSAPVSPPPGSYLCHLLFSMLSAFLAHAR